eukprot:4196965-Pyramimonas_sp.AAC.1
MTALLIMRDAPFMASHFKAKAPAVSAVVILGRGGVAQCAAGPGSGQPRAVGQGARDGSCGRSPGISSWGD